MQVYHIQAYTNISFLGNEFDRIGTIKDTLLKLGIVVNFDDIFYEAEEHLLF